MKLDEVHQRGGKEVYQKGTDDKARMGVEEAKGLTAQNTDFTHVGRRRRSQTNYCIDLTFLYYSPRCIQA